jgi:hypothetical protein
MVTTSELKARLHSKLVIKKLSKILTLTNSLRKITSNLTVKPFSILS